MRSQEDAYAWGITSPGEPRWPALLAVLVAIELQLILPDSLIQGLGNRPLFPVMEGALMVVLLIANPGHISKEQSRLRIVGVGSIAVITVANVVSLGELIHALLYGSKAGGRPLVYASVPIWANQRHRVRALVLGPRPWWAGIQTARRAPRPDFLFPQMATPGSSPGWVPSLLDYLYTSFTNATAFSPTDTMPLTAWAKSLMTVQSLASLVAVAVVVSRAVNILT
jgi:uncharacterized membrane protein